MAGSADDAPDFGKHIEHAADLASKDDMVISHAVEILEYQRHDVHSKVVPHERGNGVLAQNCLTTVLSSGLIVQPRKCSIKDKMCDCW